MDPIRSSWEAKRLDDATPLPLVVLRLPMGDRVYSIVKTNAGASLVGGGFFDADVSYDADVYFNADAVVIEEAARLVSVDAIEQTSRPIDTNVLGAFSQSERPTGGFELENGDRGMSQIVGQEYLLRQEAFVYATFPGLDAIDALMKRRGRVTTWTLTKASLRVEFEGL